MHIKKREYKFLGSDFWSLKNEALDSNWKWNIKKKLFIKNIQPEIWIINSLWKKICKELEMN